MPSVPTPLAERVIDIISVADAAEPVMFHSNLYLTKKERINVMRDDTGEKMAYAHRSATNLEQKRRQVGRKR